MNIESRKQLSGGKTFVVERGKNSRYLPWQQPDTAAEISPPSLIDPGYWVNINRPICPYRTKKQTRPDTALTRLTPHHFVTTELKLN